MRILALETTEALGSVAAASGSTLLAEVRLNPDRARRLAGPGMVAVLETVGWKPGDVELVAVTIGPGSFTGLRVGLATAKTFAYAVGARLLGVDTLETIAAGVPGDVAALSAVIDAQRGEVVSQRFVRDLDAWLQPTGPQELLSIEAWLAGLTPGTELRSGAGKTAEASARGGVGGRFVFLASHGGPGCPLGAGLDAAGQRDDLWSLVPRYSRRSAAEEKLRIKDGNLPE